jgi:hypothetical protein
MEKTSNLFFKGGEIFGDVLSSVCVSLHVDEEDRGEGPGLG